jgi:hypothetical protein
MELSIRIWVVSGGDSLDEPESLEVGQYETKRAIE